MGDFDWTGRVAEVIQRMSDRGREEYIDMVDDVVEGLTIEEILSKRGAKEKALAAALADATAIVHGPRPMPPLAQGGWYGPKDDGFEVASGFSTAWRAAREGGGAA